MDKFGIFNLLNSLLSPSLDSQEQKSERNDLEKSQNQDLLSGLLNGLKGNQQAFTPQERTSSDAPEKDAKSTHPPLQRQMLNTISAHEQIIKRVNQKPKV